ncbi:MAG: PAS domain S-box protein [Verrucomicrobiae bacterium]
MKILAIDDNPDNLTVLRAVALERLPEVGFHTAPDGPKGIELARAEDPDVILLDIVMPGMDGYEVCRKLKADARLQTIPVLFLTAQNDRDSHIKALEAGADGFLSKPFDEIELTVQIRVMAKVKAAAVMQRDDAARLAGLVAERTLALQKSQAAALNLLEDLRTENAARKTSEFRMRAITDSAQDAILMMDPEGLISYWNPAAERIFGHTSDEAIGQNLHALIVPPRYHAAQQAAFPAFLKTGLGASMGKTLDMEALRKDGKEISVQLSLSAIRIGDAWHSVGIIRDVTEHRLEEEELKNLRKAVEQSANTIVITDPLGNIGYVNPAFENISGYTAAEALGRNPRVLKSGEQTGEFYTDLWKTIASGKTWRGEFHNKRKDGTLYWESATISPVLNDSGEIVHFIAVKEDISDRKALEASLHEALIRAETAARTKSEFLSMMSHELRTPLNGVLGFAELLSDSPLDDEQKDFVRTISSSGEHLLAIVNDILDLSSLEKGRMPIETAPVVVADLVETTCIPVRKSAADRELEFRCETDPGVPAQIAGDVRRIRQILINLLANAVKFTEKGTVVLRLAPASDHGRPALDFLVEDTGIGISSETLSRLFQPFTQADATSHRAFQGTGLGLVISHRLATAMGGSLTVASAPGKGSTFTFRLPLETSFPQSGSASDRNMPSETRPD